MSYLHLIMVPGVTSALSVHLFDCFTLSNHEIAENRSQNLSGQHPCEHTSGCVCDGFGQGCLICCFMERWDCSTRARSSGFLLSLGIPLLVTVMVLSSCGCRGSLNCLAAGEAIAVLLLSSGI